MSVPSKGKVGGTRPFGAGLGTAGGAAASAQTSRTERTAEVEMRSKG